MTVLPTERVVPETPALVPAETQADFETTAHPRLERRRQRRRHRIEAALVIASFPVAVAVTLFMLLTASGGSVFSAEETTATPTVRVEGALSTDAADRLTGEGLAVEVRSPGADRGRPEVVYFSGADRARAEAIAEAVGAEVVVLGTTRPAGATFVIRVGEDLAP